MRVVTFLVALLSYATALGQATLLNDDFEGGIIYTFSGDIAQNSWRINTCAGNGTSLPGSNALYISNGGAVPGCGVNGTDQYAYADATGAPAATIAHLTLDATCASNIQVSFDYTISTDGTNDYAELVYSNDGGTSWTPVGGILPASASWSSTNIGLPGILDFSSFELGFRFSYDNITNAGSPLAVDNLVVTGTDNVAPVLTCELTADLPITANCEAVVSDYKKEVITISDNCTDSIDITYLYNPLPGTVLSGVPGDFFSVQLTAVDEAGNLSNTCSITFEIIDDIYPAFDYCPTDTSIYTDASCEAVLGDYLTVVTATDNCSSALTYTQTAPAGTLISGTTTTSVTIEVEDESGNTNQCTFDVVSVDTLVPTITCPPNQSLYANTSCQANLIDYTSMAVIADNCTPSGLLSVTQSPVAGTTITANQLITLEVSGGTPATPQQCSFTVQFIDTIQPGISCPVIATQYYDANCERVIADFTGGILWSDNCESVISNMTVTQTPAPGTLTQTNSVITIDIEDPSGNSASCTTLFNLVDTINPTVACPPSQNIPTDASCTSTLPDFVPFATGSDNCTTSGILNYFQSPAVGTVVSAPTAITITVEDASGNEGECQFTVTPFDNTMPNISCPTTVQASTDSGCTHLLADMTGLVTTDDNCTATGNLMITQSPVAGTPLSPGTSLIVITVEDATGNSNACDIQLTVIDATPPTFTNCLPGANAYSDGNCDAVLGDYTGDVSYTDNCSALADMVIDQSPAAGTTITSAQLVTITVTDEAGNSETCSFTATIADTIDPVVNCPAGTSLAINSNCEYLIPDFESQVNGTDNCSVFANMVVGQNPAAGSTQNGTTNVIITLTDEQGNTSACSVEITPIDNVPPQITCPSPAPVDNGVNCDHVLGYYGTTAPVVDNCNNYTIDQTPVQGSTVQTGTTDITLVVTDAGGNTASCTFPLMVIETEAPTISCPGNISTCDPLVTYTDPTFNDNCFAFLTQTDNTGLTSGDLFPIGTTILEYTVSDSSNNTDNCTFSVEILDYPSQANILEDTIAVCNQNTALIEAELNTSGTGEWSVFSGQASLNNQFSNQTGVNNLGTGTSILVWTVSSATCGFTSDTLVLINSQAPSQANTQDTLFACDQSQINLLTAAPSSGTGLWSSPQGATIGNPNNPTTIAFNIPFGWNEFIWTISNPGCTSTSDTMHVFKTGNVTVLNADTIMCYDTQVPVNLIAANIDPSQTASWQFMSGFGILSNSTASATTVSNLELGDNVIVFEADHPLCPSDADTVHIIINYCEGYEPVFPTVITPNHDGKNDIFVIQNLEKVYPDCHITIFNRWGSVVFESTGYAVPWDGTYEGEDLPMGTYFFKLELNDEENTIFNGPISVIH